MSKALVVGVLVLAVTAAVLGFVAWKLAWPMQMGVHGYIAFVLGSVLTAGLTVALMRLAFFSAQKGYDDIERED